MFDHELGSGQKSRQVAKCRPKAEAILPHFSGGSSFVINIFKNTVFCLNYSHCPYKPSARGLPTHYFAHPFYAFVHVFQHSLAN